jgi:hypothetical protein
MFAQFLALLVMGGAFHLSFSAEVPVTSKNDDKNIVVIANAHKLQKRFNTRKLLYHDDTTALIHEIADKKMDAVDFTKAVVDLVDDFVNIRHGNLAGFPAIARQTKYSYADKALDIILEDQQRTLANIKNSRLIQRHLGMIP